MFPAPLSNKLVTIEDTILYLKLFRRTVIKNRFKPLATYA